MDCAAKKLVAYCLSVWATRYVLTLVQTSFGVRRLISECDRCAVVVRKAWFSRFRRKKGKSEPGCETCSAFEEERRQIAATRVVPENHATRSGSRTKGASGGVRGVGDENVVGHLVCSDTAGPQNEASSIERYRGDAEARWSVRGRDGSAPMSRTRLCHAHRLVRVESTEEDNILAAHRVLGTLDPDSFKLAVGLNSFLWTMMAIGLHLHRKEFFSRRAQPQTARLQQRIASGTRRRTRVWSSVSERSCQRWEDWDTISLKDFMAEEVRTMGNPERAGQVTTFRDKNRLVRLAREWQIPFLEKAEFRKQQAAASRLGWVIDSASGRLTPRRGHPHLPMTQPLPQPNATSASLTERRRRAQSGGSLTPRITATLGTISTGPGGGGGEPVEGMRSEGGGRGSGQTIGRGGGRGGGLSVRGEDRRSLHRAFVSDWVSCEGVVVYEVEVEVLGVGDVVTRVYRRYTDFLHLWKAVCSTYPTMRDFAFPPKKVIFGSRNVFTAGFGGETVEDERRKCFADLLADMVNLEPRPPELLKFLSPRLVEGATRTPGTPGNLDPFIGNPYRRGEPNNLGRRRGGSRVPPQHATERSTIYQHAVPVPRNLQLATFLACVGVTQFYFALHTLGAVSLTVLFLLTVDTSLAATLFLCVRRVSLRRQSDPMGPVEERHERVVDRRPPSSGGRQSSGVDAVTGRARGVRELSPLRRPMSTSAGGIRQRLHGVRSTEGKRRVKETQYLDRCSCVSGCNVRGVCGAARGTSQVGTSSSDIASKSERAGRGDAGACIWWEKIAMVGEIGVAGVMALAVVVSERDCSFLGQVVMALRVPIAVIAPPLFAGVTTAIAGWAAHAASAADGMSTDFVQASPVSVCVHSGGRFPAVQQSNLDGKSGGEALLWDAE